MTAWMQFLLAITPVLFELYQYLAGPGAKDPEEERQILLRIIRAAKDAQARSELGG